MFATACLGLTPEFLPPPSLHIDIKGFISYLLPQRCTTSTPDYTQRSTFPPTPPSLYIIYPSLHRAGLPPQPHQPTPVPTRRPAKVWVDFASLPPPVRGPNRLGGPPNAARNGGRDAGEGGTVAVVMERRGFGWSGVLFLGSGFYIGMLGAVILDGCGWTWTWTCDENSTERSVVCLTELDNLTPCFFKVTF